MSMKKDVLEINELIPKKPSLIDQKDALGQGDTYFRASTSIVNVNVSKP